jgi:hypothetical protein
MPAPTVSQLLNALQLIVDSGEGNLPVFLDADCADTDGVYYTCEFLLPDAAEVSPEPTPRISLSPAAIREHYADDDADDAQWVTAADNATLLAVGRDVTSNDVIWDAYHDALTEAVRYAREQQSAAAAA